MVSKLSTIYWVGTRVFICSVLWHSAVGRVIQNFVLGSSQSFEDESKCVKENRFAFRCDYFMPTHV